MAKFSPSELKKSLENNLTLLHHMNNDSDDYKWVEYHEIENEIKKGYFILNEEKRDLYNRMIIKRGKRNGKNHS